MKETDKNVDPAVGATSPKVKPEKDVGEKQKVKPRHAPMYRVLIHNDDKTPMVFVISVVCRIFGKNGQVATKIMLTAHNAGVALVDVLPLEEAEFRVERAHAMARTAKYPLTFSYEPE